MKPVRAVCPYCGEATHMAPAEIVLALRDADGITGDYAYTCPQCLRTGAHTADAETIADLLSAGVVPLPVEPGTAKKSAPSTETQH